MREGVRREKYITDALAAAALGNGLREHARRKAVLHELAVGYDARA